MRWLDGITDSTDMNLSKFWLNNNYHPFTYQVFKILKMTPIKKYLTHFQSQNKKRYYFWITWFTQYKCRKESFLLNLHKWNFDWLKFQMVEVVYPLTVSLMALLFQLFQVNSTSIQVPEVKTSITVKQWRMPALEADCLGLNFCCPTY